MCAKHRIEKNTHLQFIMCYFAKLCVKIVKRILRLTLYELLWTALLFVIIIIVSTWNNDTSTVQKTVLNPVIMWWTTGFSGTSETRVCPNYIKCDVYNRNDTHLHNKIGAYLFYGSNINFDDLPLPRKPRDVIWGLYHEESPRNVEELLHEEILNLFNFSSTLSRHSDVPFPLQYLESFQDITNIKYYVETSVKNSFLKEISPIMYLQSDCETSTERDAYVKELMKYTKIDSYGACLNNKELPAKFKKDYLNNLGEDEFLKFIARYKFAIAIENGVCDDYVTEKFWRPIKLGVVPIYFGSPSIKDWYPNNKSAILLDDFPTPKVMYAHIKKLMADDKLYEEYLEHKTKQIVRNKRLNDELKIRPYQTDPLQTVEEFECFICKQLHDKLNGHTKYNIVTKNHYNCPKPISALSLQVNPSNDWVYSWETAKQKAQEILKSVTNDE